VATWHAPISGISPFTPTLRSRQDWRFGWFFINRFAKLRAHYDQSRTCSASAAVAKRHPDAAVIIPPRSTAVPSETAANSAINISPPSRCTAASAGDEASGSPDAARLKLRCIDTRRSSAVVFTPGFCPINGPRRRSDAMSSTGRRASECPFPFASSQTSS
jgi:hypothetical protein